MRADIKLTSSVKSSDRKINIQVDNAFALSDALKLAQQAYAASRIASEYKPTLTSLAKRLNTKVEIAFAEALGGVPIKEGTGGFYPDFFIKDEETGNIQYEEQKLVTVTEQDGKLTRKSPISLAGGTGITLSRGNAELLTGFEVKGNKVVPIKEQVFLSRFVNDLLANKDNPAALVTILSGRGKAATAIRSTLSLKANSINIPVVYGGVLQNRTIKFTWDSIKKSILNKKMTIFIEETANGVRLNLYFSSSVINKALNDMQKVIIKEVNDNFDKEILYALAEMVSLPSNKTNTELKKFLADNGFEHIARYVVGSAIIAKGVIGASRNKTKTTANTQKPQKFISSAQWTFLVQKRLGDSMLSFGDPEPPDIKERSGRFRSSVDVTANYKTKTIKYTYNPLYRSLEHYGYHPELQVERSIRQVAQDLYAREFSILRRGSLA